MAASGFLPGSAKARRMVALACLSQNCSTGLVLGSYGALIPAIETSFATTRAISSLGIGVFALMIGLLSPVIGYLLRRISVRSMLTAGAAIHALGYLALSQVHDVSAFLLVFGLLIGTGAATMSAIAPATLVSRWYRDARGRALGLVNLPLFLILIPPIAAAVVTRFGMSAWFLCLAALFALLVPLMRTIVDQPDQAGEIAHGAMAPSRGEAEPARIDMAAFLIKPQFWLLTLGVGLSSGAGSAFLTHIIPFAASEGISVQSASLLVTTYGVAGLVGNVAFGALADRFGAVITLAVSALGQAILWAALLLANGFPMLIGVAALIGMFTASVIALHGAAVNELFGPENVSGALGMGYLFKLPFSFGSAPLAGYLFVVTASYHAPFEIFAAGLLAAALGFAALSVLRPTPRAQLEGER